MGVPQIVHSKQDFHGFFILTQPFWGTSIYGNQWKFPIFSIWLLFLKLQNPGKSSNHFSPSWGFESDFQLWFERWKMGDVDGPWQRYGSRDQCTLLQWKVRSVGLFLSHRYGGIEYPTMLLSEVIFGLCVPPNYLFSPPFFSASDVSAEVIQYVCSQTCTFQNHRHLKVSGNWDQSLVHQGPHGKEYQNQFWPFRATPKKVKPSTFLGSYLMSNKQC